MRIEGIYARWVPVPDAGGDRLVFESMSEVKALVIGAVTEVEKDFQAADAPGCQSH